MRMPSRDLTDVTLVSLDHDGPDDHDDKMKMMMKMKMKMKMRFGDEIYQVMKVI